MKVRVTEPRRAMRELRRDEPLADHAPGAELGLVAHRLRLFEPRRTKQPSRSSQAIDSARAASQPAVTSDCTSGSPSAQRTETDFGTENVRSNPGTRRAWDLSSAAVRRQAGSRRETGEDGAQVVALDVAVEAEQRRHRYRPNVPGASPAPV